eukprot:1160078-Pelagomonas_calceolata.AAC.2
MQAARKSCVVNWLRFDSNKDTPPNNFETLSIGVEWEGNLVVVSDILLLLLLWGAGNARHTTAYNGSRLLGLVE